MEYNSASKASSSIRHLRATSPRGAYRDPTIGIIRNYEGWLMDVYILEIAI